MYFSSGHHARPEDYADEARYWKEERGWTGYKLHPPRAPWLAPPSPPIGFDVEACAAVRDAVGPEMALMLDSSWSYSYTQAMTVGRAIQELDYLWYEDPLPALDIHGYRRLKQHLHIPLLATETTPGGLEALAAWITAGATDLLRGDVVIKGGITGLVKIARLAEAFGMGCEVHDGYNALNNVANLHVILAADNCEWFEVLAFNRSGDHSLEHLNYGLAEPFAIDSSGVVHAPTGPGLGVDVDWELIDSAVDRVVGSTPQPAGGSWRPSAKCHASRSSSQSPPPSNRRNRIPVSVTSAPPLSIVTQNSTAAWRPSAAAIGAPNLSEPRPGLP